MSAPPWASFASGAYTLTQLERACQIQSRCPLSFPKASERGRNQARITLSFCVLALFDVCITAKNRTRNQLPNGYTGGRGEGRGLGGPKVGAMLPSVPPSGPFRSKRLSHWRACVCGRRWTVHCAGLLLTVKATGSGRQGAPLKGKELNL